MIGPNGAGKTTAFNLLTGVYAPTSGAIQFQGQSIAGHKPYQIAAPALRAPFRISAFSLHSPFWTMSAPPRIMHYKPSLLSAVWRGAGFAQAESAALEQSRALLDRFGLLKYEQEFAKNLAYGEQRRLEIARALATQPKLLAAG